AGADARALAHELANLVHAVAEAPAGHLSHRLAHDAAAHLGLADLALGESNRNLTHVSALVDGAPCHIHLEDITCGIHGVEIHPLQQVPLEGAVTAGDVGEAGAQRHGSVDVAATGEELAVGRPVHGLAALNVAGTQDELRAIVDLVQQQVELLRGVGAVGVHLAENLITVLDAPLETGQVGPTEAALTFAVQHVDAGVVFGHLIRQLPGTVRRVVVDNEEIDTLR